MIASLSDRLTEWLLGAFIAVFGWVWRTHARVSELEIHQRYTRDTLDRMENKLDVLLKKQR